MDINVGSANRIKFLDSLLCILLGVGSCVSFQKSVNTDNDINEECGCRFKKNSGWCSSASWHIESDG